VSRKNYEGPRTGDEVEAKLLELALIPKKEKPSLSALEQDDLDSAIKAMLDDFAEPQYSLAIRYAIKTLTECLPKRVAK
jgi:hypothetical protein